MKYFLKRLPIALMFGLVWVVLVLPKNLKATQDDSLGSYKDSIITKMVVLENEVVSLKDSLESYKNEKTIRFGDFTLDQILKYASLLVGILAASVGVLALIFGYKYFREHKRLEELEDEVRDTQKQLTELINTTINKWNAALEDKIAEAQKDLNTQQEKNVAQLEGIGRSVSKGSSKMEGIIMQFQAIENDMFAEVEHRIDTMINWTKELLTLLGQKVPDEKLNILFDKMYEDEAGRNYYSSYKRDLLSPLKDVRQRALWFFYDNGRPDVLSAIEKISEGPAEDPELRVDAHRAIVAITKRSKGKREED